MALVIGICAIAALALFFLWLEGHFEKNPPETITYVTVEETPETWTWPPRWQDSAHVSHDGKTRVGL
jgi:hypothetical protein